MIHARQSIINDEIVNQNVENTDNNVKSSEEAMEVVKEIEKITRSNKYSILWLANQQVQILERFKLNYNFRNMVNQFTVYGVINTINEIIVLLKMYATKKIV